MFIIILWQYIFTYPWTWHLIYIPVSVFSIVGYLLAWYLYKYIDVNDKNFFKYYIIFILVISTLAILWDRFGWVINIWN